MLCFVMLCYAISNPQKEICQTGHRTSDSCSQYCAPRSKLPEKLVGRQISLINEDYLKRCNKRRRRRHTSISDESGRLFVYSEIKKKKKMFVLITLETE